MTRQRFGHAVALDEGEAEGVLEAFELGRDRRTAGDDGPEAEDKGAVDGAEAPPADAEGEGFGLLELRGEGREALEEVGAEEVEDAGDGDEDLDAVKGDEVEESGEVEVVGEVEFGGEQGGDPEAHEVAEDVADGKGLEETEGVDEALVATIAGDFGFDGGEAGEDVAVGVDDAFGVRGGAGGENDLKGAMSWTAGLTVTSGWGGWGGGGWRW